MTFPAVPLRRIFSVVNGGTPTADAENWDGGVAWATPVDLGLCNGGYVRETLRTLTEEGLKSGSAVVSASSLIVSTRAPIGYVAETTKPTAFNQGCRGLAPRTSVDVRFFRYALIAAGGALQSNGQGSTFSELSTESLASLRVPHPSPDLQRSIADFLDAETARIDALSSQYIALIKLVAERERTSTAELLDELPFVKLKRIASLLPGYTFSSDAFSHDGANERLLRGINVAPGAIDLSDCVRLRERAGADLKQYELAEGDVVVGMDRPFISAGTRVAKVSHDAAGALLVQRVCRLRFSSVEQAELALAALAGPRFVEHVEHSLTGVSVPHLSEDQIGDFEVPLVLPSTKGQLASAIRRTNSRTTALVATCEQARARLAERKQALITAAVTGELDLAREIAGEAS